MPASSKPPKKRTSLFFSYESSDFEAVNKYYYDLQAADYQVYFDQNDEHTELSIHQRLEQAINSCDIFIFFLSPRSASAEYPRHELELARKRWPRPGHNIIYVTIEKVEREAFPGPLRGAHPLPFETQGPAPLISELGRIAADARASRTRRSTSLVSFTVAAPLFMGSILAITAHPWMRNQLLSMNATVRGQNTLAKGRLLTLGKAINELEQESDRIEEEIRSLRAMYDKILQNCLDDPRKEKYGKEKQIAIKGTIRRLTNDTEMIKKKIRFLQKEGESLTRELEELGPNSADPPTDERTADLATHKPSTPVLDEESLPEPEKGLPAPARRAIELARKSFDAFQTFEVIDMKIGRWYELHRRPPIVSEADEFLRIAGITSHELTFHAIIIRYIKRGEINRPKLASLNTVDAELFDKAAILLLDR